MYILVISLGSTKPPATTWRWDRVSPWNIWKPSHLDMAVCPRKFQWIYIYIYNIW